MSQKAMHRAVAVSTIVLASAAIGRADFSYNFDSLTPGGPLNPDVTIGAVGQDNWVFASGSNSAQVHNEPVTGFSGNYITSTTAIPAAGYDAIQTRVGANLGIGGSQYVTFQFDGLTGPGYLNTTNAQIYKRSEIAPGIDANLDGDIRGTSSSTENSEVAFQFGYEATGAGWYVRRTSYSNTGTITAATTATGVYRMQLVVDFNANPTASGVNDGAGTLYVKQLADAAGNPVDDVFRVASPSTVNVNLGISGMGTFGAADPANWNGVDTRVANNGGIDNIVFTKGLPTTTSTWSTDAGDWLSSGNWYIGVPNGIGAQAMFTSGARVNSTVYADSPVTVGTITFNNAGHSYNISGNGTLTLQTSSGSALVDVQAGSHKLNIPLIVASNTTLNVANGATLKISDPMTVNSGVTVSQTGAGTVSYESNVTVLGGGNLAVGNSTAMHALSLSGNASLTAHSGATAKTLTVDSLAVTGGHLDLTNNKMTLPSTEAAVRGMLASGAIFSSLASGSRNLGYNDVGGGKVNVAYTLLGDTDLSGNVNFDDLLSLAQHYGAASNGTWKTGDFNYDGVVNFNDLLSLAQQYGSTLTGSFAGDWALAQSSVPEPTTFLLMGLPALAMRRRRR